MNNIPKSSKKWQFVTMETVTFKFEVQKNTFSALNHSNYVVKTEFFPKVQSYVNMATCYSSVQSYFKIDLDLTIYSIFTFYIENHEPIQPLTKNCRNLDKNKSIMSRFSVVLLYKSAVSTVQKQQQCGMFQFSSVNVCICTSI